VNVAMKVSGRQEGSGLTEHLSGLFVDNFILKELFFSLEPSEGRRPNRNPEQALNSANPKTTPEEQALEAR
jgi:hypothetical protein